MPMNPRRSITQNFEYEFKKKNLWKRSLINENNLYLKTWTTTAKKTATAKHWQWNVFFFFFRLNSERSKEQPWFHHWITRGRQQMQLPITMANGPRRAHQLSATRSRGPCRAHFFFFTCLKKSTCLTCFI